MMPTPVGKGWELGSGGELAIDWISILPALQTVLEMIRCHVCYKLTHGWVTYSAASGLVLLDKRHVRMLPLCTAEGLYNII